jgi:hypothetical protein
VRDRDSEHALSCRLIAELPTLVCPVYRSPLTPPSTPVALALFPPLALTIPVASNEFVLAIQTMDSIAHAVVDIIDDVKVFRAYFPSALAAGAQLPSCINATNATQAMQSKLEMLAASSVLRFVNLTVPPLVSLLSDVHSAQTFLTLLRGVPVNTTVVPARGVRYASALSVLAGGVGTTLPLGVALWARVNGTAWDAHLRGGSDGVGVYTLVPQLVGTGRPAWPGWFGSLGPDLNSTRDALNSIAAIVDSLLFQSSSGSGDFPAALTDALPRLTTLSAQVEAGRGDLQSPLMGVATSVMFTTDTLVLTADVMCDATAAAALLAVRDLAALLAAPANTSALASLRESQRDVMSKMAAVANLFTIMNSQGVRPPVVALFEDALRNLRASDLDSVVGVAKAAQTFVATYVTALNGTMVSSLVNTSATTASFLAAMSHAASTLPGEKLESLIDELLGVADVVTSWVDDGSTVLEFVSKLLQIASNFPSLTDFANTARAHVDNIRAVLARATIDVATATGFFMTARNTNQAATMFANVAAAAWKDAGVELLNTTGGVTPLRVTAVGAAKLRATASLDVGTAAFVTQFTLALDGLNAAIAAPLNDSLTALNASIAYVSRLQGGGRLQAALAALVQAAGGDSVTQVAASCTALSSLAAPVGERAAAFRALRALGQSMLEGTAAPGALLNPLNGPSAVASGVDTVTSTYASTVADGSLPCPQCGIAALVSLRAACTAALSSLGTALALVSATNASYGLYADLARGVGYARSLTAAGRAANATFMSTMNSTTLVLPLDADGIEAAVGSVATATLHAHDAADAADRTAAQLTALNVTLANTVAFVSTDQTGALKKLHGVLDHLATFGTALVHVADNDVWKLLSYVFGQGSGLLETVQSIAKQVATQFDKVVTILNRITTVVDRVDEVVGAIRSGFLMLSSAEAAREGVKVPLPTCASASDPSVPPCLHSLYRASEVVRTYIFPVNYFTLWFLAKRRSADRTFVTPGAYDGYTLAGTCFVGLARNVASVYNANAAALGKAMPPVVVLHTRAGAAWQLTAVFTLADKGNVTITGLVTGVAEFGDSFVVSLVPALGGSGSVPTTGSLLSYATAGLLEAVGGVGTLVATANLALSALAPSGGISVVNVPSGGCALVVSNGLEEAEQDKSVLYGPWRDCALPSSLPSDPAMTLFPGPNVAGLALFVSDSSWYAMVARCKLDKGYDCAVYFYLVTNSTSAFPCAKADCSDSPGVTVTTNWRKAEETYTLLIPSGLGGFYYDGHPSGQFLVGFAGGSQQLEAQMKSMGRVIEDSVSIVDLPIFVTMPPTVTRNIVSLKLLGNDVFTPFCAVPVKKNCEVQGSRRRALQAGGASDGGAVDTSGIKISLPLVSKEIILVDITNTVIVIVVPVLYYIRISVLLGATLEGEVFIADQMARFGVVPGGSMVISAGAGINLFVVQAGIELRGVVMDAKLRPMLTVQIQAGGKIRACLDCDIAINPLTMQLNAFYAVFACFSWKRICLWSFCFSVPWIDWCPQSRFTLVEFKMATIVIPLFAICNRPVSPALPAPPPSVRPLQVATNLTADWDACSSQKSRIEQYTVCAETRPGAEDVAPCANAGSALHWEFPGVLEPLPHGASVFVRVVCATLEGGRSENVSLPLIVDKVPPLVLVATQRMYQALVNDTAVGGKAAGRRQLQLDGSAASAASDNDVQTLLDNQINVKGSGLAPGFTNETSILVTFDVYPSLCVSSVNFTVSMSSNASDSSSYLLSPGSAGPGTAIKDTSTSTALVPAPSSGPTSAPAVGWSQPRHFEQLVSGLALVDVAYLYTIVFTQGCTGVSSTSVSPVALVYDPTPPELVLQEPDVALVGNQSIMTTGRLAIQSESRRIKLHVPRGDCSRIEQDCAQRSSVSANAHCCVFVRSICCPPSGPPLPGYPHLMYAAWAHPTDLDSGVSDVFGQFFLNGTVASEFMPVLGVQEVQSLPYAPIPDATRLAFILTMRNSAGVVATISATTVVDASPPVCGDATYVLPPYLLDNQLVVADPTTRLVTLTADVVCADPHTGVTLTGLAVRVGTYPGGADVTTTSVNTTRLSEGVGDSEVGVFGDNTLRGTVVFRGMQGKRYYVSFVVQNGVGLATTGLAPLGLLFTELQPKVQGSRFGRGDQVGVHRAFDNATRTTQYTLDNVFTDDYAQLVSGQLQLMVCSGGEVGTVGSACVAQVSATVTFTGAPPRVAPLTAIRLQHGDVYYGNVTWCNQASLCTNTLSRSTFCDTVPPVSAGFVGASLSPEAAESAPETPMRFQTGDDVAFTITDTYDVDSFVTDMQVRVEAVGRGDDLLAVTRCVAQSVSTEDVSGTQPAASYPWVPLDASNARNTHQEHYVEAPTTHNTFYRVRMRSLDAADNRGEGATTCVLVDKTPVVVAFADFLQSEVVTLDRGLFLRDNTSDALPPGRALSVKSTAVNDVSGVSYGRMCCGTSIDSCALYLDEVTPRVSWALAAVALWPCCFACACCGVVLSCRCRRRYPPES